MELLGTWQDNPCEKHEGWSLRHEPAEAALVIMHSTVLMYVESTDLDGVPVHHLRPQVLQALLPWITESFSVEEQAAMMGSLRQVGAAVSQAHVTATM